jgi:hypothetical protein
MAGLRQAPHPGSHSAGAVEFLPDEVSDKIEKTMPEQTGGLYALPFVQIVTA